MKKMMLVASLMLYCGVSAIAEDWGTISGQVVVTGEIPAPVLLHAKGAPVKDPAVCAAADTYKDDLIIDADSKGLANVFIYLQKAPKSIHPDLKKPDPAVLIFDQKGCMFSPHAMIVRCGQTVEVISSDAIAHNTHTNPIKNPPVNVLIAPNTPAGKGLAINYMLGDRLPVKVNCDFHPWMLAHWLVVDHPYAAVTDKDGKFSIPNLPVGEHNFIVWHERRGYFDFDAADPKINKDYIVKVQKGDNALKPLEIKIDDLKGDGK